MNKKIFLILGVCLCVCALTRTGFPQYQFINGNDWAKVDTYDISNEEKISLKIIFLKAVYGVGVFDNNPVVTLINEDFPVYVSLVDRVYQSAQYRNLPLQFALKAADMMRNGDSQAGVQNFIMAVTAKLNQLKL